MDVEEAMKRQFVKMLPWFLILVNLFIFAKAGSQCLESFKLESAFNRNRVLGKNRCVEKQWPFVVQILVKNSGNCTGSIIGDRWILTASHCLIRETDYSNTPLPPEDFTIFAESVRHGENAKIYNVEEVVAHWQYNKLGDHDIGLLKVITFSFLIRKWYQNPR